MAVLMADGSEMQLLEVSHLKGRHMTLKIRGIDYLGKEGHSGAFNFERQAKKRELRFRADVAVYLSFEDTFKRLQLNKLNYTCISKMFEGRPWYSWWPGKRITLFPAKVRIGRKEVECIRIWGSPDIPRDIEITQYGHFGFSKQRMPTGGSWEAVAGSSLKMTMHAVKDENQKEKGGK